MLASIMSAMRCTALKADGTPCRTYALDGKAFCLFHDPERAALRTAARRKGGLRRAGSLARKVLADAGPLALKTPAEVAEYLCGAIGAVQSGKLDHRIGATLNGLAGTLLKALDAGELAERLAALELAVASRGGA